MPTSTPSRIPTYRLHAASGNAVVTLSGRDFYLGPHGSAESRAEYDRLIREWLNAGRQPLHAQCDLTVNEIILQYWSFAEGYYRKPDGRATGEQRAIREALKPLRRLYGYSIAREFGPLALESTRGEMIRAGWCRSVINQHVGRIKRAFKWAVAKELVPPDVFHGLQAVVGLRRGRSAARETEPVHPVPEDIVEKTLPHLAPPVVAMVRLQLLTGMRPGEVVIMRRSDLDVSGPVWTYSPSDHKTQHHGIARTVFLGPRAQDAIKPFLQLDGSAFLFSPTDAMAWRNADKRRHRKSPLTPSQAARRPKTNPRWAPRDRYDTSSYRRAISYGAKRAGVSHWAPNQLRHSAATRLRREFGIDAARTILGHRLLETTQVYAERDTAKAAEIMTRIG